MSHPAVFILRDGRAKFLTILPSASLAARVACCVRLEFGLPAWVEDYFTPATGPTLRYRDGLDQVRP